LRFEHREESSRHRGYRRSGPAWRTWRRLRAAWIEDSRWGTSVGESRRTGATIKAHTDDGVGECCSARRPYAGIGERASTCGIRATATW